MPKKNIILIFITVLFLLCIPLIAMQFSNEVDWNPFDFLIAGILFLSAGLLINYITRKIHKKKTKLLLVLGIISIVVLIFIELAVGIFNSPIAGT